MLRLPPGYIIKCLLITILVIAFAAIGFTQSISTIDYKNKYRVRIKKIIDEIKIDGEISDPAWKNADIATDFWEVLDRDKDPAKHQTEIRLAYNDRFIFISILCYDTLPYIGATLKRDTKAGNSDVFGVLLDPMNQQANGFIFAVSAYNVQCEDVLSTGNDFNWTWDNKWFSATKQYADRWTGEMAIPFKTLRYSADKTEWGINFIRGDQKNAQWSMWTKVPTNINWFDFGYYGTLEWDAPPPVPGKNISLIPYATGTVESDKENNEKVRGKFNAGIDGKIAISSGMNLDLTVNPDFSQIEVDEQVTNLTRFNIFFPEKRTFFLENADLYADLGYDMIRPFYSRTIGLDPEGNAIPIIAGARLSGNLNKKLRIGLMNMETLAKNDFPAQNYTAFVMKQRIWKRSLINAYFLNRQSFMNDEQEKNKPLDLFGRNAGLEVLFTNNTSTWKATGGYHHSFKPGIDGKNYFVNTGVKYSGKKLGWLVDYNDVGTNYYADMGFIGRINNYDAHLDSVLRLGFKQLSAQLEYNIYPKNGKINRHVLGIENHSYMNPDGGLNDQLNRLRYSSNFKNWSVLLVQWERSDTRLLYYTKFTDAEPLPPGKYVYDQWNIKYESDPRKDLTLSAGLRQGSFYNGNLLSANTTVAIRKQPWGNFSILIDYSRIHFPEPYGKTELLLMIAKTEIGFSTSVFWTTFLQYNAQENNFNINSRFQWRFKPMSDLFVVYTDNYFTDPLFKNKSRALVFKMNYWLGL